MSKAMKVSIAITVAVLLLGPVLLFVRSRKLDTRAQSYQDNVVRCIELDTGRNTSFYDWDMARDRKISTIMTDLGLTENQVRDCQDRWGEQ